MNGTITFVDPNPTAAAETLPVLQRHDFTELRFNPVKRTTTLTIGEGWTKGTVIESDYIVAQMICKPINPLPARFLFESQLGVPAILYKVTELQHDQVIAEPVLQP